VSANGQNWPLISSLESCVNGDRGTLREDEDKGVGQMDRADGNYADVSLRKVGGVSFRVSNSQILNAT
jgi:hypothetical protein